MKLPLGLVVLGACIGSTVMMAADKKPITHELLWQFKRVSAPAPSPDGKWVVFSVSTPAYDPKEQTADLWIKSLTDDTPARRLTATKSAESGVDWSPDGTRVVFSAKREGDENNQLYVINIHGGEAERVTDLVLGARRPKWSPDGKQLLFVSDAYPGAVDEAANKKALAERKARKFTGRTYDSFPVRYWDKWLDDRKPHLFVQEARPEAEARDLLAKTKLAADPGFSGAFSDEGENLEAEWTPDGKGVVFCASINQHEVVRANVAVQIFLQKLDGSEPRRLTQDTAAYGQLAFSPSGDRLFAQVGAQTPGEVYDLTKLAAFPWPFRNERTVLTEGFDRSVTRYAVPSDQDRLYFTAESSGLEKLYSVASAGGEVRSEPSPDTGCFSGVNAGGSALVALWESAVSPAEVYRVGGAPKRLTDFNSSLAAEIDWQPPEHFTFRSSFGHDVHSMLIKPPGFSSWKKYPLFVVIHGGAANMWRDGITYRWNYHLLAKPGYVVLLTDYFGSTGYGEAFSRRIKQDPLRGPAKEIDEAVDEALKRFSFIDKKRLAAGGASYGGHLANWMQATTTRYRAFVSHAGEADLIMQWGTSDAVYHREVNAGSPIWGDSPVWRDQSPALQAGNQAKGTGFKAPILITVGELDYRVPANNAYAWFTLNQRLNVPSRLLIFPDEGHWVTKGENSRQMYNEIHAWLAKWLD